MTRRGIFAVGFLGLGAGCLPPPPTCDDGCAQSTEDGTAGPTGGPGDATVGDDASETAGPSEGSDADDGSESDDGSGSDDTTGESPTECSDAIEGLYTSFDSKGGYDSGNCRFHVGFTPDASWALSHILMPQGHNDNMLIVANEAQPERLSGVHEFPEVASWQGSDPAGMGYVELQNGPALFRIRVDWESDASNGFQIAGRSIYTVIADGRVMRDHFVHLFNEAETPSGSWLVDYTSLRADYLTGVEWDGTSTGDYVVANRTGGDADFFVDGAGQELYVCAYSEVGDVIGMASYPTSDPPWAGQRGTRVDLDPANPTVTDAIALQADWYRNTTIPMNGYVFGNTMLVLDVDTSSDPCAAVAAQHAAYVDPPDLMVQSGGIVYPGDVGDDDDDAFSEGGGFYSFDLDGSGEPLVLEVGAGATVPSALLFIGNARESDIAGVSIDGSPLTRERFIVQNADEESDVGLNPEFGELLPAGVFILLGEPVSDGQTIELVVN